MTARNRLLWFGGSGVVIVLGVVAGALIGGVTGEAIMIALGSVGGIAIVSLVFFEVGLSEDRERERETVAAQERDRPVERMRRRPPLRRRRP
jgi:hypothetical protein